MTVCTILCSSVLLFCCAVRCCTKQSFRCSVFWSLGVCSRFDLVSLLLRVFWSPVNSNWWQLFKLCPVPGTEFPLYWKNVYLTLTVHYNSVKESLNVNVCVNFLVIMKNIGMWKREPLRLEAPKLFSSVQQEIWSLLLHFCFLSLLFASVCFPFSSALNIIFPQLSNDTLSFDFWLCCFWFLVGDSHDWADFCLGSFFVQGSWKYSKLVILGGFRLLDKVISFDISIMISAQRKMENILKANAFALRRCQCSCTCAHTYMCLTTHNSSYLHFSLQSCSWVSF